MQFSSNCCLIFGYVINQYTSNGIAWIDLSQQCITVITVRKCCPNINETNDRNQTIVDDHLRIAHPGISATTFIVAQRIDERKRIQSLYEEAYDYLDNNFANVFLREFDQRSWELCTYKYLKENGVTIFKSSSDEGPDFNTDIGYVECIAVTRGSGKNAIPIPQASILQEDGTFYPEVDALEVPTNEIKMRISSAYSEKQRKYEGYYSKHWFDKEKPRLIAINWHCEGTSWQSDSRNIMTNASLQTLFGTGFPEIVIDPSTKKVVDERLSHIPIIKNAKGSPINVGYFAMPPSSDQKRIDGVILSSKWAGLCMPQTYRIVNNPFTNTIEFDYISIGHKTIATLDGSGIKIFSE